MSGSFKNTFIPDNTNVLRIFGQASLGNLYIQIINKYSWNINILTAYSLNTLLSIFRVCFKITFVEYFWKNIRLIIFYKRSLNIIVKIKFWFRFRLIFDNDSTLNYN